MPKAFCHWSSKFGCVLQEFLIFIRCLVRIPMFGGIFVLQELIMERYNDISLNSRSVYQLLRQLASTFFFFFFFFAKRLLSNKGLRYSASLREKKYNHALPFLNIINPLFLCVPPPLPLRSVLCSRVLD